MEPAAAEGRRNCFKFLPNLQHVYLFCLPPMVNPPRHADSHDHRHQKHVADREFHWAAFGGSGAFTRCQMSSSFNPLASVPDTKHLSPSTRILNGCTASRNPTIPPVANSIVSV